jgi:hypothetical protein
MVSPAQSPKASNCSLQTSSNIAANWFVHFVSRLITKKYTAKQKYNIVELPLGHWIELFHCIWQEHHRYIIQQHQQVTPLQPDWHYIVQFIQSCYWSKFIIEK